MNREILFVQGGGQGVHDEWDNELVGSLRRELGPGYDIHYPRMPNEADPKYAAWKTALEGALGTLRSGAVLVGHSIGATVLLGVLAERSGVVQFGAILALAAPFVGDGGWSSDDLKLPRDLGERLPQGVPVHFYHGLDDQDVPVSHVELYARAVPRARVERLEGRDHQFNNDLREIAAAISALAQPERP